jgi:hypothetical protein
MNTPDASLLDDPEMARTERRIRELLTHYEDATPVNSVAGRVRERLAAAGETAPAESRARWRSAPRISMPHSVGGWALGVVSVGLVAALIVSFVALIGQRHAAPPVATTPAPTIPAGWRLYHDPLGLFAIGVPPGWKASGGANGTITVGGPTGSFSGRSEYIVFHNPAHGAASAQVAVSAEEINSDFWRQWYCRPPAGPWVKPTVTTFNGYRAQVYGPPTTGWMFESYNAHFQVDITIPGVLVPPHYGNPYNPPPTPTALPQATVTADRALLTQILSTLKPSREPLVCK